LPQKIVFKVISNETTAANLLLTGGLDVARVVGPDLDRLSADNSMLHKSAASFIVFPLVFNHDSGHPTADEKVREALISAVDPNQWNQIVYKGRGVVSPSFVAPSNDCFDSTAAQYLPSNPGPEKAKAILLAAGWTAGADGKFVKDGVPLTINFDATTAGLGSGPEYIAEQWSKAGISVDAHIVEFNTYLQSMLNGNFDALIQQTSGDYPDPNAAVQFFLGQAPYPNIARTVNPEAAAEREAARATVGDERCQHWSNVQRSLLQQHNYLPLASPVTDWFARDIDLVPGVQSVDVRYLKRLK
jgi:peptide/nickel transport system substrate-binding protein